MYCSLNVEARQTEITYTVCSLEEEIPTSGHGSVIRLWCCVTLHSNSTPQAGWTGHPLERGADTAEPRPKEDNVIYLIVSSFLLSDQSIWTIRQMNSNLCNKFKSDKSSARLCREKDWNCSWREDFHREAGDVVLASSWNQPSERALHLGKTPNQ
jgi:hypothetical protein